MYRIGLQVFALTEMSHISHETRTDKIAHCLFAVRHQSTGGEWTRLNRLSNIFCAAVAVWLADLSTKTVVRVQSPAK